MKGLSFNELQKVRQSGGKRGIYGKRFQEFLDSDELGIEPAASWPIDFGYRTEETPEGKTPEAISQGFKNVIEKLGLSNVVSVKIADDRVFVWHEERLAVAEAAEVDSLVEAA
jgi:hypothetical protein